MKVTALVSVYNSSEWLRNRLENLMGTTLYKNNQLVIYCTNASSPDPQDHEIMVEYASKPNIIYDTILFCSVYQTWNHIIKNSNSDFLINANSDDIVSPDCYEILAKALDNGSDFAYSSWYTTHIPNQQWPPSNIDPSGRPGHYVGNIETAGVGHGPMWRRSLHDRFGLFDERFLSLGDADWWGRCHFVGKAKFQWIDQFLLCYLWRGNDQNLWNRTNTAEEWQLYHSKIQEYKNQ